MAASPSYVFVLKNFIVDENKFDEFGDKIEQVEQINSSTKENRCVIAASKSATITGTDIDEEYRALTLVVGGEERVIGGLCNMYLELIEQSVLNGIPNEFLADKSVVSMDMIVEEILNHLKERISNTYFEVNPINYSKFIPSEILSSICPVADKDTLLLRLRQLQPYLHLIEEEICRKTEV